MRALFLKEWIKLRRTLAVLLATNIAFLVYLFFSIRREFTLEHAEMLFYQANRIGRLFYASFQYVPLITGAVLAVAQFVPEVTRGRLRLSLHLPVSLPVLILSHLAIGCAALGFILALDTGGLVIIIGTWFPGAFVVSALHTALPWVLAGFVTYTLGALVLFEPVLTRRLALLVLGASFVALFHLSLHRSAYEGALSGLAALTVLTIPAVLATAYRFRNGEGR